MVAWDDGSGNWGAGKAESMCEWRKVPGLAGGCIS